MTEQYHIVCDCCLCDDIVYGAEVCRHCGAEIEYIHEGNKVAKTFTWTACILTLIVGGIICGPVMGMPAGLLVPFLAVLTAVVGFLTFKRISENVGNREIIRFTRKKPTGVFMGVSVPLDLN